MAHPLLVTKQRDAGGPKSFTRPQAKGRSEVTPRKDLSSMQGSSDSELSLKRDGSTRNRHIASLSNLWHKTVSRMPTLSKKDASKGQIARAAHASSTSQSDSQTDEGEQHQIDKPATSKDDTTSSQRKKGLFKRRSLGNIFGTSSRKTLKRYIKSEEALATSVGSDVETPVHDRFPSASLVAPELPKVRASGNFEKECVIITGEPPTVQPPICLGKQTPQLLEIQTGDGQPPFLDLGDAVEDQVPDVSLSALALAKRPRSLDLKKLLVDASAAADLDFITSALDKGKGKEKQTSKPPSTDQHVHLESGTPRPVEVKSPLEVANKALEAESSNMVASIKTTDAASAVIQAEMSNKILPAVNTEVTDPPSTIFPVEMSNRIVPVVNTALSRFPGDSDSRDAVASTEATGPRIKEVTVRDAGYTPNEKPEFETSTREHILRSEDWESDITVAGLEKDNVPDTTLMRKRSDDGQLQEYLSLPRNVSEGEAETKPKYGKWLSRSAIPVTDNSTMTREIHRETMDTGRLAVIPDMTLELESTKRNEYSIIYPPNYVSKPRVTSMNALIMEPLLNTATERHLVISDSKGRAITSNGSSNLSVDSGGSEIRRRKTKSMTFIKNIDISSLDNSYNQMRKLAFPGDSIGGPESRSETSVYYDGGSWDVCEDCSDVDDVF
ncbi:uncharacterized protein CLUP02_03429 [Colletotrichum lupini]|uniref:Uncharacterized protein n=1 Tax=Colletotrichum lupini TaxID=145971 RepID=A0A9Q8SIG6_9PEZI|nr:uncharacterized protein CLUP02_03429 [Colletotrichum lupini]UQC77956.1 hypothetical protein CLUP02_03429 [Colletotrichum lupini]